MSLGYVLTYYSISVCNWVDWLILLAHSRRRPKMRQVSSSSPRLGRTRRSRVLVLLSIPRFIRTNYSYSTRTGKTIVFSLRYGVKTLSKKEIHPCPMPPNPTVPLVWNQPHILPQNKAGRKWKHPQKTPNKERIQLSPHFPPSQLWGKQGRPFFSFFKAQETFLCQ